MSKARKLRQHIRRSRRRSEVSNHKDCHHIFFQRKEWQSGLKSKLRMHWYCRVYIPKDTLHKEIHALVRKVPVPSYYNLRSAIEQLKLLEKYGAIRESDNLERRLGVLVALFECADDATADALKMQLQIVKRFYQPP